MELRPQAQSKLARQKLAEMDTNEPSSLAIRSELVRLARFPLTSDHDWAERATIELARLRDGRRSALEQTQGDGGYHAKVVEAVARHHLRRCQSRILQSSQHERASAKARGEGTG